MSALDKLSSLVPKGNDLSDDTYTERPSVSVNGVKITGAVDSQLIRTVVDCDVNMPDMFELVFQGEDPDILSEANLDIGAQVEISAGEDGDVLIDGEVTSLEAECVEVVVVLRVRGYDRSHRMHAVRRSRAFTSQSDSQIAEALAEQAGLRLGRIEDSGITHEHIAQVNETDWEFLRRRAQEIGFEAYVVRGTFHYRDRAAGNGKPTIGTRGAKGLTGGSRRVELTFGQNLVEFHPTVSGTGLPKSVDAHVWDPATSEVVIGRARIATQSVELDDTDPLTLAGKFAPGPALPGVGGAGKGSWKKATPAGAGGAGKSPWKKATPAGMGSLGAGDPDTTFVVSDRPVSDRAQTQRQADRVAASAADQLAGSFAEATGIAVGNPDIEVGTRLAVRGVPEVFRGTYTVTSTRHIFDEHETGGYYTHFVTSGRQDRSLLGVLNGGEGGAASGIQGVFCGVVQAIDDPEGLGRVKVGLPWLSTDFVTDWARTVHPGLGARGGAFFLPEVGDEVLVAFELGDPRRPYVVGGLRNRSTVLATEGQHVVTRGALTEVVERGFYTPSGLHLVFQDEAPTTMPTPPKQARIALGSDRDQLALVLDPLAGTVELTCEPTKSTRKQVTIRCGPNGTVDITTSGTGAINVDAGSGGRVTVHGGDLTLTGDKSVNIESKGPVSIKGLKIDLN